MKVTIPGSEHHGGLNEITVEIANHCLTCGAPRGVNAEGKSTLKRGLAYDGSRRLVVDMWTNPCGHTDSYDKVRKEVVARETGSDWRDLYDDGTPDYPPYKRGTRVKIIAKPFEENANIVERTGYIVERESRLWGYDGAPDEFMWLYDVRLDDALNPRGIDARHISRYSDKGAHGVISVEDTVLAPVEYGVRSDRFERGLPTLIIGLMRACAINGNVTPDYGPTDGTAKPGTWYYRVKMTLGDDGTDDNLKHPRTIEGDYHDTFNHVPSPAWILYTWLKEAIGVTGTDYEEWCDNHIFDPDEDGVERMYSDVEAMTVKLRDFLGDYFDDFITAANKGVKIA